MAEFDEGYGVAPFRGLVEAAPGADAYPPDAFRLEWGPIFHRGRLDGSARILVIGQDPAAHEAIARRILVGEAGQRVQAFLGVLGVVRSYVMVNALLYSVYGRAGSQHAADPAVVDYRHRWLDAVLTASPIEAVVAFGRLADRAWQTWTGLSPSSAALPYAAVPHPTMPESSSAGDPVKLKAAYEQMLTRWNEALTELHTRITHPDTPGPLVPFDVGARPATAPIPAADLPAGCPAWMRSVQSWARREGADDESKRATIVVTVPEGERPWHAESSPDGG
jgi:uracil-DNA glycosylase